MKYHIDPSSKKAAYLQLYEQFRKDIVEKVYPENGKLPSKRLLADEAGVSLVTVEHAYVLLCEEGYIEARERSGYYVTFRQSDYFSGTANAVPARTVSHAAPAGTQTFPFSVLARTMRKVLNDYGEAILTKSPNAGCPEVRDALSQYLLRSRGISAGPEQIIIGSGAEYLYGLVTELLGLDRVYGLESPSYKQIEKVYRASGVRCDMLPLSSDGIDSAALAQTNATVLHLTPYRSFPSGITASASKRHEYVRWCRMGDRFIVEDDFESEFSVSSKPEETLFSLSGGENVLYLNTFSKTISPSLRIGYMVLPVRLVEPFADKLGFYSCTVPTFEQFVLADLLTSGNFERHVNRVRREKRKEGEEGAKTKMGTKH
ncbi:MAG: PLP-dependent aminotransferase family protein [Eubacteriales bacterium]